MKARGIRIVKEEPPQAEPLLSVRAGESLIVRIGAVDRQSGVTEIVAECRTRGSHAMTSVGRWSPRVGGVGPGDNYFPVIVPIPDHAPTTVWEVHRITLGDAEGNRRSFDSGTDFEEILFQVLDRPSVDCTPPRLLGVKLSRA